MAQFWLLLNVVKQILDLCKYLSGQMSLGEYNRKLKDCSDACARAGSGELEKRLKGGKDVENLFNNNAL